MNNQTDKRIVNQCKTMSFKELENYIGNCFAKLNSSDGYEEVIPLQKEIYEILLTLLEAKFNEEFSSSTKENVFLNSLKTLEILRSSFQQEVEKIIAKDEISTNQLLRKIDSNILILTSSLEELLKAFFFGNEFVNNILNSSAKFIEKVKSVFGIADPQVQEVNRKYFLDFLNLIELSFEVKTDFSNLSRNREINSFSKSKLENNLNKLKSLNQENKDLKIKLKFAKKFDIRLQFLKRKYEIENAIKEIKKEIPTLTEKIKHSENELTRILNRNLFVEYNQALKNIELAINNIIKQINFELSEINRNKSNFVDEILITQAQNSILSLKRQKGKIFEESLENIKSRVFLYLPFEVFPKGERTINQIVQKLSAGGIKISTEDENKLRRIEKEFNYDSICVGKEDFKGYVIFRFNQKKAVIAEKPSYGNATYIMRGDWRKLLFQLQLSKMDVRQLPDTDFVIHQNLTQWLTELKDKFYNYS